MLLFDVCFDAGWLESSLWQLVLRRLSSVPGWLSTHQQHYKQRWRDYWRRECLDDYQRHYNLFDDHHCEVLCLLPHLRRRLAGCLYTMVLCVLSSMLLHHRDNNGQRDSERVQPRNLWNNFRWMESGLRELVLPWLSSVPVYNDQHYHQHNSDWPDHNHEHDDNYQHH